MNFGIVQGRLSPPIDGKIQEFPMNSWDKEFETAKKIGLSHIEWIITKNELFNNPIFTKDVSNLPISSICCDHLIDKNIQEYDFLESNLELLCTKLEENGIGFLSIPLLEESNMEDDARRKKFIKNINKFHKKHKYVDFIFETELTPGKTAEIVNSNEFFFVTYDTGNITSYLKKHDSYITLLKEKIVNVHIKDRTFDGKTKHFLSGDTDFKSIFKLLSAVKYNGLYTLQLARDKDGEEAEYIEKTLKKVKNELAKSI